MGGRWSRMVLVLSTICLLCDAASAERQVKTAARPMREGQGGEAERNALEKSAREKNALEKSARGNPPHERSAGIEDAAEYQPPERFIERQRPDEYLPYARQFLQARPDHPQAPRILLDMLLLASVQRDPTTMVATKARLLMEHPWSLPTAYVIKTAQPGELRQLLKEQFNRSDRPLDRHTLAQLARGLEICLREYGGAFADDDIWAMTAVAMDTPPLAQRCRQQLQKPDGDAARTIDIHLDPHLTARLRFLSLQPLRGYAPARAYQQFLYHEQMTESDRQENEVRAVIIENLLHDRRFAAARPLLDEICRASRQPRLDFWHAWAQAAQNDRMAAQATLEGLQDEFPQSTWSDAAGQLARVLDQFDVALAEQAKVLEEALDLVQRAPPERFEMTIEYSAVSTDATRSDTPKELPRSKSGDAEPKQIYVGMDLPGDAFELVARTGAKPLLAYRAGGDGNRIFLPGDLAVRSFAGRGMCPLFNFAVPVSPEGQPSFQFTFNTVAQGSGGLIQSARNLLAVPALATPESRRELLRHVARLGVFPERPRTDGAETVLAWVRPDVERTSVVRYEIRLTSERRLASLTGNNTWRIKEIRYGSRNGLEFAPLPWPELPAETAAEMRAGDFFRMLGAISSLLESH